jgi:hypothetical protein
MAAAAHGHSTLGIPQSVGEEFMHADQGHHFNHGGHIPAGYQPVGQGYGGVYGRTYKKMAMGGQMPMDHASFDPETSAFCSPNEGMACGGYAGGGPLSMPHYGIGGFTQQNQIMPGQAPNTYHLGQPAPAPMPSPSAGANGTLATALSPMQKYQLQQQQKQQAMQQGGGGYSYRAQGGMMGGAHESGVPGHQDSAYMGGIHTGPTTHMKQPGCDPKTMGKMMAAMACGGMYDEMMKGVK